LFDQFSEPQSLVDSPHQEQAAVERDVETMQIDLERGVEGKLKGLILYLTPWVLTSGAALSRTHSHEY